jgi:hypothetical protein
MTDIPCGMCNEPYTAYGVRESLGGSHGDMAKWEAELFLQAAGCPCCKGLPQDIDPEDAKENHVRIRVLRAPFGECELDTIQLLDTERPSWEIPEPKVIEGCTCEGCEVSVAVHPEDIDDHWSAKPGTPLKVWYGGKRVHYSRGIAREYGFFHQHEDAAEFAEPEHWRTIDDKKYCPGCAVSCSECNDVFIFTGVSTEAEDAYSPGASFQHPGKPSWGSICISCYENEQEDEC